MPSPKKNSRMYETLASAEKVECGWKFSLKASRPLGLYINIRIFFGIFRIFRDS